MQAGTDGVCACVAPSQQTHLVMTINDTVHGSQALMRLRKRGDGGGVDGGGDGDGGDGDGDGGDGRGDGDGGDGDVLVLVWFGRCRIYIIHVHLPVVPA